MIKKIKNVVYIKNEKNLGFVGSCNAGAKKAKGKYVVFLNNDTSVKKDWLSSLLETFRNNKNIGLAGSKLIYPDERLQEAGGIVWKNKNVWNYGRYQNPNDPEFNYLKDVDYCSGASIMLPKDVFEKLGGFDVIFSPGYCEDTDLAFRVRQLGLRTVYQPKSELFHFEGITAGIDSSKGMKKYQEINKKKFFKRWKDVLEKENLDDSSDGPFLARDRSKNKKILLFIDYQVPSFDKDAGSVRMFEYLKIFLELGFKIVFWPDNLHKSEPYTEILQQMGIEAVYGQQSFENYIKQFGNYFDIAYLSRPLAINYIPYLNKFSRAKIIYDCQDLHFIREKRRGELEKDPAILKQAEEIKEIELTIMRNSSAVVVLSDKEKEILEEIDPNINVAILPYIQSAQDITKNFASKKDIIFIGGFNHKPNEDAVVWFIENIFPLIKKNITEARFIILGSNPTETITKLKSEDIIVTGFIKNIDPYFQNAKVFVAPIRYGAGLKGKIIHAMSFGLPIVTTSIGAEGMNLAKNEIVKVADNPKDFAKKVIELYLSNELWKVYSDKALDFVKINNGPLFAKEKIKELINRI
jgi:glycosyltransferase involved in cell wall biosynthesis